MQRPAQAQTEGGEREGGREMHAQTHRHTHRHTGTQTHTQTHTHTDTHRMCVSMQYLIESTNCIECLPADCKCAGQRRRRVRLAAACSPTPRAPKPPELQVPPKPANHFGRGPECKRVWVNGIDDWCNSVGVVVCEVQQQWGQPPVANLHVAVQEHKHLCRGWGGGKQG